mmetsp:Transcript_14379/g.26467  ORF Transcript_14379/g.26467 Transcript_14379/m.26467 type:complete len:314 (-) Transcript_14379:254-1195(-)
MGCVLSPNGKSQLSNAEQPAKRELSNVRAFKLTVHRKEGEKLGVELVTTLDGKALLVLDVKPGLVMELNKTHQETPILAGHSILSINGIRDDPDAMKAQLGSKDVLELIVAPFPMVAKKEGEAEAEKHPTADVTVKLENPKAEPLGLKVASADGSSLQVVDVLDGYCKVHNEKAPQEEIRVGDAIVALQAGDIKLEGDAIKLLTTLAKLGSGVLTLRRQSMEVEKKEVVEESKQEQPATAEGQQEEQQAAVNPSTEAVDKTEVEQAKDDVPPIQEPEEPDTVVAAPAVVVDATEVRRGGVFSFCCAPKVESAQ